MKTTRWIPLLWVGLLMGGLPLAATLHAEDAELFPLLEELDTEDTLPALEELPLLPANDAAETTAPVTQTPVFVAQQPATPAETAAIPEPPAEVSTPAQTPVEIPVVEANSEPAVADDLLTPPVASPQAPLTEEKTVVVPEPAVVATEPLPTAPEAPKTVLPPTAPTQVTTPDATSQSVVVSKTETAAPAGTVVTETVVPTTTAVPCQECCEYVPVYPRRLPAAIYGVPRPIGYGGYMVPARGPGRYYERGERGTRRLLPDTGYTLRGPRDFDDPNPRPIGP